MIASGVSSRGAPEDDPWSTYRGDSDASQSLRWASYDILLRQLSPDPESARRKYRELVERDSAPRPAAPWKNIREGCFLGSDSWVRRNLLDGRSVRVVRALAGRSLPSPGFDARLIHSSAAPAAHHPDEPRRAALRSRGRAPSEERDEHDLVALRVAFPVRAPRIA
jgi:hypothetical protein